MSGDENTEDIDDEEKQKIYTHFCQLMTILHDYAIGKKLFSENIFSWAITANYYSLMHCGRFICNLGIEIYPEGHAQMHKLLSGESSWRSFNSQQISISLDRYISNSEDKIKTLGNKLEIAKKIRECNSYDLFIIAHQNNHIFLENVFLNCYSKIEIINRDYINFCLDLLVGYINKSPSKQFYIAFLKNRSEIYENPIQSFINESIFVHGINKEIMCDIKQLIDNKLNFETDMILPSSFFDPIHVQNFESKKSDMNTFKDYVDEL